MATAPVPPRNDQSTGVKIYAQSRAVELQGRDSEFVYQYFHATDPKHPQYIGKRTVEHEIGDAQVGFCMVPGWVVCEKGEVIPGRPRDDSGKAIDNSVRHGELILAKLPVKNFAAYELIRNLRDAVSSKRMLNGDAAQPRITVEGGQGQFRSGITQNAPIGASHVDALNGPRS